MCKLRFVLSCGLLLLVVASVLSCGANHGQLKSISISPAAATGQAQFTATGTYSDGSKVSSLPALWSEGNPWVSSDVAPVGIVVTQSTKKVRGEYYVFYESALSRNHHDSFWVHWLHWMAFRYCLWDSGVSDSGRRSLCDWIRRNRHRWNPCHAVLAQERLKGEISHAFRLNQIELSPGRQKYM
jgi:hypothetical protein